MEDTENAQRFDYLAQAGTLKYICFPENVMPEPSTDQVKTAPALAIESISQALGNLGNQLSREWNAMLSQSKGILLAEWQASLALTNELVSLSGGGTPEVAEFMVPRIESELLRRPDFFRAWLSLSHSERADCRQNWQALIVQHLDS